MLLNQTWSCGSSLNASGKRTSHLCNADADPLFATSEDDLEPGVEREAPEDEGEAPEDEDEEAPRHSAAHHVDALSLQPHLSALLRHKVPYT